MSGRTSPSVLATSCEAFSNDHAKLSIHHCAWTCLSESTCNVKLRIHSFQADEFKRPDTVCNMPLLDKRPDYQLMGLGSKSHTRLRQCLDGIRRLKATKLIVLEAGRLRHMWVWNTNSFVFCFLMVNALQLKLLTLIGESLTETTQAITSTIHWGLITTWSLRNSLSKCCTVPRSWRNLNACVVWKGRVYRSFLKIIRCGADGKRSSRSDDGVGFLRSFLFTSKLYYQLPNIAYRGDHVLVDDSKLLPSMAVQEYSHLIWGRN
jgi:hypothetical protein